MVPFTVPGIPTFFSPTLISLGHCSEGSVKNGTRVTKLLFELIYLKMILGHFNLKDVDLGYKSLCVKMQ